MKEEERLVAYFSMEIGLESSMKTYSGGLGVLAGDTIKSAADLKVPMIAVTLLNEKGYFLQKINKNGEQEEYDDLWNKEKLVKQDAEILLTIEGRKVRVNAWMYLYKGANEYSVPVLFLDTNIEGNSDYDKRLTSVLYGGDEKYRLCQEMVLGIGGIRMLDKLGFKNILRYHMNEGHASFLTIELYNRFKNEKNPIDEVRNKCVFTTHTPVSSGHDKFSTELVKRVFPDFPFSIKEVFDEERKLNMTLLGLFFSTHINGVAKKHGEITHKMFPLYQIDYITNGVHSLTWTNEEFKKLFDLHIPGWRQDSFSLRYAVGIPDEEIWKAHEKAKEILIEKVNKTENAGMDKEVFTIGFARRATPYKRADLLFNNLEKLKEIAKKHGKIQIIYAGKAHPKDYDGKNLIKEIISLKSRLGEDISLVYLQNYDIELAKLLVSGCDLWLNTPKKPMEASGTSGMKAAHNGVPSLSVLDGWWIEGWMEGITGWSIGTLESSSDGEDANDLYEKLDQKVIPIFYFDRKKWIRIMKNAIAFNASFFNSQRMVYQYVLNCYFE